MKKLLLIASVTIAGLALAFGVAVFVEERRFVANAGHNGGADIPRYAGYQARWALLAYARTGNIDTVEYWLDNSYLDGGPAISAGLVLRQWTMRNQNHFLKLVSELGESRRQTLVKLLVFGVSEVKGGSRFRRAFRGFSSEILDTILADIEACEKWSEERHRKSIVN